VLDHLADVESDLSAFHRIDSMMTVPGPRFFRLAIRLSAYAGIMQARVAAVANDDQPPTPTAQAAGRPGTRDTYVPDTVTAASVALDPLLGRLISFGNAAE